MAFLCDHAPNNPALETVREKIKNHAWRPQAHQRASRVTGADTQSDFALSRLIRGDSGVTTQRGRIVGHGHGTTSGRGGPHQGATRNILPPTHHKGTVQGCEINAHAGSVGTGRVQQLET